MKDVVLLYIVMSTPCSIVYAERTVWYVHPDSALNTIQAGLDSCANNDIVLVGPGTYYENIVWPNTQGINLISELGSNLTVIDGDTTSRVIEISTGIDTSSLIRGFTIQNGRDTIGAGIYCGVASSPTITDNNINNNTAGNGIVSLMRWGIGGGIYCDSASSPVIINNTITDNVAGVLSGSVGGGIACFYASPTISNNRITYNAAGGFGGSGGGINCDHSSPIISGNTITNNSAMGLHGWGGGICCDSSSPLISSNTITQNSAGGSGSGGGGLCLQTASSLVTGNSISGNTANFGGGIHCTVDDSSTITGNMITGNTANSFGGGLSCKLGASPVIENCTVADNYGDGIYCYEDANPFINYNNITDNVGYGIRNASSITVNAENNWWGDVTGPYHPSLNPGGLGNAVSNYVDFDPWLNNPWGIEEEPIVKPIEACSDFAATIFHGPLRLPEGTKCKVFDITGRVVEPEKIAPGIYFVEIDNEVVEKVIKIK